MSSTMTHPPTTKQAAVSTLLKQLLANTYVIYTKTQNFHWNLIDRDFASLHKFLETQYEDLAEAADEIAERLRMIQEAAPGSMQEFLRLTTLKEAASPSAPISGADAIHQLLDDHMVIIKEMKEAIAQFDDIGDIGTADLLTQRLRAHEKTAWMLRSHL